MFRPRRRVAPDRRPRGGRRPDPRSARRVCAFEPCVCDPCCVDSRGPDRRGLEQDAHTGLPVTERLIRIRGGARTQHSHHRVVLQLLVRSLVDRRHGGPVSRILPDESRSAPRPQRRLQNRMDPCRSVVVEHDPRVVLTVLIDPCAEGPRREAFLEPQRDADGVEPVSRDPGGSAKFFNRQTRGLLDEQCYRPRPGFGQKRGVQLGIALDGRLPHPVLIAWNCGELSAPDVSAPRSIESHLATAGGASAPTGSPSTAPAPRRTGTSSSPVRSDRPTSPRDCPVMFCTSDVTLRCPLRWARPAYPRLACRPVPDLGGRRRDDQIEAFRASVASVSTARSVSSSAFCTNAVSA